VLKTSADEAVDDQEWKNFVAMQDFGQIIAFGIARRHPIVTPCHYVFDGDKKIELHLHRANPLLKAIGESPYVTFSVIAAHVFIPGYWNYAEGSDPAWAAPTSYYAAVQAMGTAQVIADPQAISDLLSRQMERFQPEGNHHLVEPGDSPFGQMLRSIRGVCMTVAEVNVKFKFGGNQNAAHRLRIADLLLARNGPGDVDAREHLLRRHSHGNQNRLV